MSLALRLRSPPGREPGWGWRPFDYDNARDGPYYDSLLVRGGVDVLPYLGPGPGWRLRAREGRWWLYEKAP